MESLSPLFFFPFEVAKGRETDEEEEEENAGGGERSFRGKERSSQRARAERVSSLAQGQALLLEREQSNISGIGERMRRG